MERVLLVEDDRELAGLLERLLISESYAVDVAHDGQRALHLLLTGGYDIVILDRGLPVSEGLEVLTIARSRGVQASTLILSARGDVADRLEGLEAGADDYLVKPFDVNELIARLRAMRRRHTESAWVLPLGHRYLYVESRSVRDLTGRLEPVALSERETDFLALLARSPSRVVSRQELRDEVFIDAESDAVVDTYVHYCRRKLGDDVIRTVRGVGYRLGHT